MSQLLVGVIAKTWHKIKNYFFSQFAQLVEDRSPASLACSPSSTRRRPTRPAPPKTPTTASGAPRPSTMAAITCRATGDIAARIVFSKYCFVCWFVKMLSCTVASCAVVSCSVVSCTVFVNCRFVNLLSYRVLAWIPSRNFRVFTYLDWGYCSPNCFQ